MKYIKKYAEKSLALCISNILSDVSIGHISAGKGYQKKKRKKWDYIKPKRLCITKEIINKIKRQPIEYENIFTDTSDKGLISKIYKELIKLNTKTKTNNPIKKMGIGPEQTLLQRGRTHGQETYERCSMSLIIREIQIKTTMRYHLTSVRMAIISKSTNKC